MLQLVDQPTEHGELDEFSYDNAPPKAAKGTPTNRQTLLDGKLWHLTPFRPARPCEADPACRSNGCQREKPTQEQAYG